MFAKGRAILCLFRDFSVFIGVPFPVAGHGPQKRVLFKEKSSGLGGITESKVLGSRGCSLGIEMYLLLRAKQFFFFLIPKSQFARC